MVVTGEDEGVTALIGSVVMMDGISTSPSKSNEDGKLMDIDNDMASSSASNTSENMGGLLVSLRRCLRVVGSSIIRRVALGDMTVLTSRIR